MSNGKPVQPTLKLVSKPFGLAMDGHAITIRDDNTVEVVFFQIVDQAGNEINASGLATIRMTVEQLKALSNAINITIKEHEEKKRGQKKKNGH